MKKNQDNIHADKVKGALIKRTAIKTLVPEDIVEKVIMFQFKDARDQVRLHEQIEISGFGKLMTSPSKIRRRLERIERGLKAMEDRENNRVEEIPEKKKAFQDAMMQNAKEAIAYLKTKKGGYETKP